MWSVSSKFSHQNSVYFLTPVTWPFHLVAFCLITIMMFDVGYRSRRSSVCSFLQFHVTFSVLASDIFLTTLFCKTLSLCSVLNVSDQVSQPLYINLFICLYIYILTHTHTHIYIYIYIYNLSTLCRSNVSYEKHRWVKKEFVGKYKVVQIWPGQVRLVYTQISPGHIWTTL
jgi:hypothetical protein